MKIYVAIQREREREKETEEERDALLHWGQKILKPITKNKHEIKYK